MSREYCMMKDTVGSVIFCGYFDCMYMKCEDVIDCPEHLDDDDDEEDIEDEE